MSAQSSSLPAPATLVLAVSVVIAVAPAAFLWSAFGETIRVVFLVALTVALLPAMVYRGLWPADYGRPRAVVWAVGACVVVSAELAALMGALAGPLGADLAVIVAFAAVFAGNYYLPRRYAG